MPYSPSFWADAAGEAAEAGNLNDLEARVEAAVPAFNQRTWTQKTSATPLSAAELNKLEARFGVNLDVLAPDPAAVTDWGPAINTAISNGARFFRGSGRDYPFSTKIEATDIHGVVFAGESESIDAGAATNRTRFIWKGTGSGYAVDVDKSTPTWGFGLHCERITWLVDNPATFTGFLFNFNNSFFSSFHRCYLDTTNSVSSSAIAIDAKNMNTLVADMCYFGSGLKAGVRAILPSEAGAFSTVNRYTDCTFWGVAVENPGVELFDRCVFQLNGLASGESAIYDTAAYNAGAGTVTQITIRDAEYWDVNGAAAPSTNRVVHMQYNWCNFTARDCFDHDSGSNMAALYTLAKGGTTQASTVNIDGGSTLNDIDVGDAASGGYKSSVRVSTFGAHANAQLLNHNTGHGHVDTSGCWGIAGSNFRSIGARTRIKHELGNMAGSTVTVAAGATGITVADKYAGDLAGIIRIDNSSGSPSSTGKIVDVTLHEAPVLEALSHATYFSVQLTPIDSPVSGATNAIQNFYVCQVYAIVANNDLTKWSVGIKTAIPNGQGIALAYRVTVLETA